MVRSRTIDGLAALEPRVRACFEAGALATGCTVTYEEAVPGLLAHGGRPRAPGGLPGQRRGPSAGTSRPTTPGPRCPRSPPTWPTCRWPCPPSTRSSGSRPHGAVNHQPNSPPPASPRRPTPRSATGRGAGLDGHRRGHRPRRCAVNGCSARDHRARRPRGHPRPRRTSSSRPWNGPRRSSPAARGSSRYGSSAASRTQHLPAPGRVGIPRGPHRRLPGLAAYEEWRPALHHFYDPFPVVEHFERVADGLKMNISRQSSRPRSRCRRAGAPPRCSRSMRRLTCAPHAVPSGGACSPLSR
jgi:hypothetical protein